MRPSLFIHRNEIRRASLRRPQKGIFDNIAQVHAPAAGSHTTYELSRRPFRLGDRREDSMLHDISLTFSVTMTNQSGSASIVSDDARWSAFPTCAFPTWLAPVVIVGLPVRWLAILFGLLSAVINRPIVEEPAVRVGSAPV